MVFSAARNVAEAPHRSLLSPQSSNNGALQGLKATRQFWYDDSHGTMMSDYALDVVEDEATHELREVLGHKVGYLHDWTPALAGPGGCLSAGSTEATTPPRWGTPPPPTTSPPLSAHSSDTAAFDGSDESPAHCLAHKNPSNQHDKELWKQCRKVFIGGIPQSIDQDGFYAMFNQMGKIEKAWLQWQHDVDGRALQKHRGFGFVIFRDRRTVDQMLGQEMSKYIWFGNALKLEVKRAFGKTDFIYCTPHTDYNKTLKGKNQQHKLSGSHTSSPSPSQMWGSTFNDLGTGSSSPSSCNSLMSHPWLYHNLPGVPPFPCTESQVMDPSQSRGTSMPTSPPQRHIHDQSPPPALSHPECMTSALLAGIVGQRDRQELEQMLRAALPDRYED